MRLVHCDFILAYAGLLLLQDIIVTYTISAKLVVYFRNT